MPTAGRPPILSRPVPGATWGDLTMLYERICISQLSLDEDQRINLSNLAVHVIMEHTFFIFHDSHRQPYNNNKPADLVF